MGSECLRDGLRDPLLVEEEGALVCVACCRGRELHLYHSDARVAVVGAPQLGDNQRSLETESCCCCWIWGWGCWLFGVGEDWGNGRGGGGERVGLYSGDPGALHHPDKAKRGTPTHLFVGAAWCCHQVEAKRAFPGTHTPRHVFPINIMFDAEQDREGNGMERCYLHCTLLLWHSVGGGIKV